MSKAILGKKLGMTQIFTEEGAVVPVTVVEASPNVVVRVKTVDTDGYNSIQIGYGDIKEKHLTKPVKGQFDKAGVKPVKYLRELRLDDTPEYTVGQTLAADIFASGDLVDVIGTSKGKGFAGTVKRHNFQESRNTHGFKGDIRKVGSIGSMYPQKVFKGKKMAGRMGHDRVTVKNLTVSYIDAEHNLIGLKGAVPGPNKGLVMVEGKE